MLNYGLKWLVSPSVLRMPETLWEVYTQKSRFGDRFHNAWKETTEQVGAVPCNSGSATYDPTPQLPDSALTDFNSLPSLLSPQKNLHVQAPSRTYGKLPVSYSVNSFYPWRQFIHFLSNLCKSTPTTTNVFADEDIFCPLKLNASDGELRRFISPNPSSKPRARHSLLRELNLATVSHFTPREILLYVRIRKKERALCKLRRTCRKILKFTSDVEVNTVTEDIPTFLNAEGIRLLKGIFRNSKRKPKGRRWDFEEKCWLCPFLNAVQNSTPTCDYCSLFHLDAPCNPYSILFTLQQTSMPMCSVHSSTICRNCLIEIGTVVCCLMKCQSERMSVLIRSLTLLSIMRTMEQRGLAILQIMLSFSCPVFCIESGSCQLLNTSYVEELSLISLCKSWSRFSFSFVVFLVFSYLWRFFLTSSFLGLLLKSQYW